MTKRKALGKGLSALIPDADGIGSGGQSYFQCPIELIEPNPDQPRKEFANDELEELALSVREKGIITPVLVSKVESGYRLIAGERRWRAAQKAGLKRIPVVVRESTPVESLELSLIENIHRRDLNPIEEAMAYQKLLDDTKVTQEDIAKRVGKDRSTVSNMLRLLKLPMTIREDLVCGKLTTGHARVLAGLNSREEQINFRNMIIKKELSVRETERLLSKVERARTVKKKTEEAYYLESLADNLKKSLGTRVAIKRSGKKGSINIYFSSDEELERLLDRLS
ncbi:MAG: ParB/RepB/Spo0J family partition protein [Deltaproteobacteria bacterium]|nr:ParB/RepB/Spo0J family partition protein [Deltaproteobacteria bacterium]